MSDDAAQAAIRNDINVVTGLLLRIAATACPNGPTTQKSQAIVAFGEIAVARAIATLGRDDPTIWDKQNERPAR